MHLQDQLAEVTGRMEHGGPLPSTVLDDPHSKKTVSVIDGDLDQELPINPSPGDKAARSVEQTVESSPSDTSETWSVRVKELGRLAEKRAVSTDNAK